jgi:hypothetical protein
VAPNVARMSEQKVQRAIRLYERMLEADESTAVEMRDALAAASRERGLLYGDRFISTILRPRFISEKTAKQAHLLGARFHYGLSRLMPVLARDRELLGDLGIHGALADLTMASPRSADTLWFNRLDGFVDRGVIRLVEFNVDSPGGAAFVEVLGDVMRKLPLFRAFSRQVPMVRRRSIPLMRRCAQQALAQRYGSVPKKPLLAIVDWSDVATTREFQIIADDFARHGMQTIVADPRELDIVRGRLCAAGRPLDLIVKRVLVTDLAQRPDDCRTLVRALRDDLVCCLNPLASQAVTTKNLLALFYEGRLDAWLTAGEREAWRRHLPWTVRVREGRVPTTIGRGRSRNTIDLMEHLAQHRDQLVLKPADAYGAEGIVLGWHCQQGEWDAHLQRVLRAGDYVAQERVAIPTERFPDADEGRLRYRIMHTEISPYTFYPRSTSECLARLSGSDFMNVKSGGGVVPTFIVRD